MCLTPIVVEVVRGDKVESVHRGRLVLLGDGGLETGAVDDEVFPRSSLKPLQAVAMLENGFIGRGPSLAIAVASHDGEPMHLEAARTSLAEAGLDESALRCPAALPSLEAAMIAWLQDGRTAAVDLPQLLGQARGDGRDLRRERLECHGLSRTRRTRCRWQRATGSHR